MVRLDSIRLSNTRSVHLCTAVRIFIENFQEGGGKFENRVRVNLKVAKQLGLAIPAEVLYRADKIIK